jgi:hypothetical protein
LEERDDSSCLRLDVSARNGSSNEEKRRKETRDSITRKNEERKAIKQVENREGRREGEESYLMVVRVASAVVRE